MEVILLVLQQVFTWYCIHRTSECQRLIHIWDEIFKSKINEIPAILHRDVTPGFLMFEN